MAEQTAPGIYLIVEFDWPNPMRPELVQRAKDFHQVLQNQTWIQEVVAASGGLGAGPSSIWIFRLENYAALDRCSATALMKSPEPMLGSFQRWQTCETKSVRKSSLCRPAPRKSGFIRMKSQIVTSKRNRIHE